MNINIDKEVRIKLNTNITNNSDSDKPEFIEFTREMLVYPNLNTQNMRKYPFLSDEFKYPENVLTKMTYQDRVNFFFSKRFLLRFLTTNPNIVKIDKANFTERDKTIEENVKIMLKLLFITTPKNNVSTSYDFVMGEQVGWGIPFDLGSFTGGSIPMINIGNKKYRFGKFTWFNEILNHPEYNELLRKCKKFIDFTDERKRIYLDKLKLKKEEFGILCKEIINDIIDFVNSGIVVEGTKISLLFYYYFILKVVTEDITEIDDKQLENIAEDIYNTINKQIKTQVDETAVKDAENELEKINAKIAEKKAALQTALQATPIVNKTIDSLNKAIENMTGNVEVAEDKLKKAKKTVIDTQKDAFITYITPIIIKDTELIDEIAPIIDNNKIAAHRGAMNKAQTNNINNKITRLKSIISSTGTSETITSIKQYITMIDSLKTEFPLDVYKNNDSRIIPNEYREFDAYMRTYKYTEKTSSNMYLQNIIDMQTSNNVKLFFSNFEKIYKKYMEGKEAEIVEPKMLKVNVVFNQKTKMYEIYVMCDLLNENAGAMQNIALNCEVKSKDMGERLIEIVENRKITAQTNKYRWNVNINRPILSTETKKDGKIDVDRNQKQNQYQNQNQNQNQYQNQIVNRNQNQNPYRNRNEKSPEENRNINQLVDITLQEIPDIKDYITKLNEYNLNIDVNNPNLLDFLNKNYPQLSNLINEYFKNENKYSKELNNKLKTLQFEVSGKIAITTDEIKKKKDRVANIDPDKIRQLELEIAKYNLYIKIIEKFIALEDKKYQLMPSSRGGGRITKRKQTTHRRKSSRNNFTRKNYKSIVTK